MHANGIPFLKVKWAFYVNAFIVFCFVLCYTVQKLNYDNPTPFCEIVTWYKTNVKTPVIGIGVLVADILYNNYVMSSLIVLR